MRTALAALLLAAVVCPHADVQAGENVPPIVSTQWLADNLNDPHVAVLQICSNRREYIRGHIPNARFVWMQWFAPSTPDGTSELPSFDEVEKTLREMGVSSRLASSSVAASIDRPLHQGSISHWSLSVWGISVRFSTVDSMRGEQNRGQSVRNLYRPFLRSSH